MRSLKTFPTSQKPREKLRQRGPENLLEEELLALVLGSGYQKQNVLSLSRKVLASHQKLEDLAQSSLESLLKIKGIGKAQASRLLACFELAERLKKQHPTAITSVDDVVKETYFIHRKQQEHLVGLYLNARTQLVHKQTLSIGSLSQTTTTSRDVLIPAFQHPSQAIILVHNHPSGDPKPSSDDVKVTQTIAQAAKTMGIQLLDHVIVAAQSHFSFRENGLLD